MDTPTKSSGPKEFFMHVLTFGLLYTFAVSFIALWWQYINIKFPDALNQYYSYGYDQLRWPMAILIVVFPVYIILARMTTKAIVADPSKKDSRMYRWLIYLTLFVSAVTVIVDLISLLYNFLGGEVTSRFLLKALVVLVVAAGIFCYYLWHLRSDVSQTAKKRRALLWGSVVLVIASIVLAFFIAGSPATARAQKFDQQRINDLQTIQYNVTSYWQINKKLPVTLQDFGPQASFTGADPVTMQPYEYRVTGPLTFELCAVFEAEGANIHPNDGRAYPLIVTWYHGIGRTCFPYSINPDLYPKPVQ